AFERVELTLQPADTLVFYTDGVTEAFNPEGDCYGSARLLSALNGGGAESPSTLAARLLAEVRAFAHGAPQSDDIALIVMRLSPGPNPALLDGPPRLTLELQATPEEVMRGVEALEGFCREHRVPEPLLFGLKLAMEEVSSNIVNHAYQKEAQHKFTVLIQHLGDRLVIETRDHGPAFNPLTAPPPPLPAAAEESSLGGLGIYLVRQYLDDLAYVREEEENVLRLVRLLPARQSPPL
ncbi:MAG TPA: ATP-binding protein, partial [Candidatus Sulfotelmatobacter sp.]|nr:ATP-binding protein [Candidatus Sulfotelmatobacter sp.]